MCVCVLHSSQTIHIFLSHMSKRSLNCSNSYWPIANVLCALVFYVFD